MTQSRPSGSGGWPWANISSGWRKLSEYLGLVSRGRRPGNRLWELLRTGRLKNFPHARIGRSYRFDVADIGLGEASAYGVS